MIAFLRTTRAIRSMTQAFYSSHQTTGIESTSRSQTEGGKMKAGKSAEVASGIFLYIYEGRTKNDVILVCSEASTVGDDHKHHLN